MYLRRTRDDVIYVVEILFDSDVLMAMERIHQETQKYAKRDQLFLLDKGN